ncbi:hypothetical protein Ancab_011780, partial [Ancistrocladus abbreviatus]
ATDDIPAAAAPAYGKSEPYVVFWNEIALASLETTSTGTVAHDYFSLVVSADADKEFNPPPISTPSRRLHLR